MRSGVKRGYAIGVPDIKTDCIMFFYSGKSGVEEFHIPTHRLLTYPQLAHFNGAHYEAKIKDVKRAAKAAKE